MWDRTIKLSPAIAILIYVVSCAPATLHAQPYEVDYQANREYGTAGDEKLTLHLATPKNADGLRPGLVIVHGGGWRAGNKDAHAQDAKDAAADGYVAVSVGYRFAPKYTFPAQVNDVKCAVRWMRAHADELNLDKERIGAIGYSAGAHLVMMLGTVDSSDDLEGNGGWAEESSKVQAVVAYFGPTNLTAEFPGISQPLVEGFVGGKRKEQSDLFLKASPIHYVDESDAPMLLFQGTKDILVPFDQATEMAATLTNAGIPGRVELLLGEGHGWGGATVEHTKAQAREFFAHWLNQAKDGE